MKRMMIAAALLLLMGSFACTKTEANCRHDWQAATETACKTCSKCGARDNSEPALIDGVYIYAPGTQDGSYAEYEINMYDGTLTVRAVSQFGEGDILMKELSCDPVTIIGENAIQISEDLVFSHGSDGTLLINYGIAAMEPKKAYTEELQVKQNPIATITMADGKTMTIELYPAVAPQTVSNFVTLANSGFYDGLTFHRVYSGFMIQGGDPDGNGTGGPGYGIIGEFAANGYVQNRLNHSRGVISMARSNAYNSAGSQFFIMHEESPHLNSLYAAFGMMIDGFDTLDAIAATPVTANAGGEQSLPIEDVVIASIRVETFGVDYSNFTRIY